MTDLPDGWEWTTLGEVGDWYGGGTPSKSNHAYWSGGTIPWVSPKDMSTDVLSETGLAVTEQAVEETSIRVVPSDSVVFVVRSGVLVHSFPVSLVPFSVVLNQDMKAISPYEGVDSHWISYMLRALDREILREFRKAGTTVASVDSARLMKLEIPLPPLAEQRRAVAALEDHLSRVGVGADFQEVARSRIRSLTRKILVDAVPSQLPEHWKLTSVQEAGSVELGRQRHPDWHNGAHMRPYLRVANVFEDRIDTADIMEMDFPPEVFERYRLAEGDILLNEGQTPELLGRPAMYRGEPQEAAFTNSLIRFRCASGIDPEWALLVFRRHMHSGRYLREVRITTNIAHLSAGRFKKVEFPVPPLEEQHDIVRRVREQLQTVDRLSGELDSSASRAEQLRRSLLREAFAGRLVEQDPNEEPASVLLERIRAERASASKTKRPRKRGASKDRSAQESPKNISADRPLPTPVGEGTQETLELDL